MGAISSRDNPRVRRWRSLARDASERRKLQRALLEGEHLISAFLQAGGKPESLMLSKAGSLRAEFVALCRQAGTAPVVLADSVFRSIVDTEAPSGMAAEIPIPSPAQDLQAAETSVFLEGIQDPGNVGAILRSAAAFGIKDAVLDPRCADAWSPKVLRAAMGAHFGMRIAERVDLASAMQRYGGKIACAVPRGGIPIAAADLSGRVGWLLGAEGQGVSEALAARATLKVTIPMPGSAESLNVAAAAAICFYETARHSRA